jgi:hypothetical protein
MTRRTSTVEKTSTGRTSNYSNKLGLGLRALLNPKSEQERGGGEGKSCHSWKGTVPPDRPTPAASDHIVSQESDECFKA